MSKDAMGDRGKAEENRWAREQDAKAIEELKKKGQAGTTGDTTGATEPKPGCKCKKSGGAQESCGCKKKGHTGSCGV